MQIAERGITRTEIIQSNAEPKIAQFKQNVFGAFRLADQRAFRDFQFDDMSGVGLCVVKGGFDSLYDR